MIPIYKIYIILMIDIYININKDASILFSDAWVCQIWGFGGQGWMALQKL